MLVSEVAHRKLDLLARFESWVQARPDEPAVELGTDRISYQMLDWRAAAVAQALGAAGCKAGSLVAVWVEDRVSLVSVMLGVARAGAVFVPFETDAPKDRTRQRLDWLKPAFLIHDAGAEASIRQPFGEFVAQCTVMPVPETDGLAPDDRTATPVKAHGAPRYIYFTSGSTGQPKGIVGSFEALGSRIAWEIDTFGIEPGTRVSQLVTPTFDPWFRDIFVSLCAGGTICIPPEIPSRMEPEMLIEWLRDARIELAHCGPALMGGLVSAPARIRRLPALRTVLTSGEMLHVSLVKRWRRRFGKQVELVNLYGATEATMIQLFHRVGPADENRSFIPVGGPLPDVKVCLVNDAGARCAPGEIGEIHIGGASLSLGYHNNRVETEKSFVVMGKDANDIFYRTGDLGIEFEPGCYRVIGRIDDQVKIRGVRVEPREVEDALAGYPLIAACAVVARSGSDGETVLVAYIVPETEYPPAVPEMRAFLRNRLPSEYVPSVFVLQKELPLSENGKVDRNRLPDPVDANVLSVRVLVPPRDATEWAVAGYWASILGLPEVGVHDDFLDLGGHSLSATRLVSALREEGIGELSLRDIFDHRTVATQAELIKARAVTGQHRRGATMVDLPATDPEPPGAETGFGCPRYPSPMFGRHQCNLVMVLSREEERSSFERIAQHVNQLDPAIRTFIVSDAAGWDAGLSANPTLVFSPTVLRRRPEGTMHISCPKPLAKSEEYRILEGRGIPVPKWIVIEDGSIPDLSGFGTYVVRKPDYGAKGAEVRIVRRDRVRWKPVVTSAAGPSPRLLVQEFVYTGLWPVSYRVSTLFGRVLYCMAITGNRARPTLKGPEDFDARGVGQSVSIVSNARDSTAELCMDAEIIHFGERAARAFPDMPLLGVDILRNAATGQLVVTEVNSLGHTWNFTPAFAATFRIELERQFDGLRKAAYILAEETQRRAGTDSIEDASEASMVPVIARATEVDGCSSRRFAVSEPNKRGPSGCAAHQPDTGEFPD